MIENASRNSQSYTSVWGVLQQIVKHIFSKDNFLMTYNKCSNVTFNGCCREEKIYTSLVNSLTLLVYEYVSIQACSRATIIVC